MVLSNIITRWFICWSDYIRVYYAAVKYLLAKHLDFLIIIKTKASFNMKINTTSCKFSWFTNDYYVVKGIRKVTVWQNVFVYPSTVAIVHEPCFIFLYFIESVIKLRKWGLGFHRKSFHLRCKLHDWGECRWSCIWKYLK
jgi:hypothetical protein